MPRYRMTVEYDGIPYVGWQRQDNGPSVQGAIEGAILSLTGEKVSIRGAGRTDSGVHAAIRRHYLYRIITRRAPLALEAGRAWWVPKDMDHEVMHAAAQTLVGRHDFTTFRSAHCQANSPVRTLDRLDVTRNGELIEIRATAQSFLHNQIRSFAGTLKLAGEGKWTVDDVRAALDARDRKACGPVAPPDGLYFMQVDYRDGVGPVDADDEQDDS
ncbi:tRNA pseudouridine synthase A [Rhizobium sp. CNPSo 3464]|uniref:tRNA pseudouridine synthase A n=1 Tax=Rhizobium sp. CNPSo 3464 TaxID=3021406 RepID=UPI00254F781D|nr:tRNA pseudouridine synthase A [Rhizobium sp. CNPSo 3464]MDK4740716.1 tRNA pseudouridine synthase A [Rhizobium sp. CNPSo 3464]